MKKLLCLFLILGLSACTSKSTSNEDDEHEKNKAYYQSLLDEGLNYASDEVVYLINDENDYDTSEGFIPDDTNQYMISRKYDSGEVITFYYMNDYMYLDINYDGNDTWYYTDVDASYAVDHSLITDEFSQKINEASSEEIDHIDYGDDSGINIASIYLEGDIVTTVEFDANDDTVLRYTYYLDNEVVVSVNYTSWTSNLPTDLNAIQKLSITDFANQTSQVFK